MESDLCCPSTPEHEVCHVVNIPSIHCPLKKTDFSFPYHLSFAYSFLARGGIYPLPLLHAGIFAGLSLCRFWTFCLDDIAMAYVGCPAVTPILHEGTMGYSFDIAWQLIDSEPRMQMFFFCSTSVNSTLKYFFSLGFSIHWPSQIFSSSSWNVNRCSIKKKV